MTAEHSHEYSTDLSCHHGDSLTLSRVHLARHDGAARLILWQAQLSKTTPWARSKESDVIGNLHDGTGQHIKSTMYLHHGIMSCKSLKLVRSCYKRQPSKIRDLSSHLLSKSYPGVEPCAYSSASSSQHVQPGQGGLHTLNTKLKLCHIARELLAKGERGGILCVGSANLDDVCVLLGLGIQSIVQLPKI